MKTPEEMVISAVGKDAFWAACRACFAGQSGTALKRALAAISQPLEPQAGRDANETYLLIGRAQVVSLLLKYADSEVTPAALAALTQPETK